MEMIDTNAPNRVFWIVGLNGEWKDQLGVEMDGVAYFYYKWPDACHCPNMVRDRDYRYMHKREFGEVIRSQDAR